MCRMVLMLTDLYLDMTPMLRIISPRYMKLWMALIMSHFGQVTVKERPQSHLNYNTRESNPFQMSHFGQVTMKDIPLSNLNYKWRKFNPSQLMQKVTVQNTVKERPQSHLYYNACNPFQMSHFGQVTMKDIPHSNLDYNIWQLNALQSVQEVTVKNWPQKNIMKKRNPWAPLS